MKIRARIFLAMSVLVGLGLCVFAKWVRDDLRRRYLETVEDGMVETANILAASVGMASKGGSLDTGPLSATFSTVSKLPLSARIYDITKTGMDLQVYVTDSRGIVVYDSDGGKALDKDYSRWNDVRLTLQGKYGARATPSPDGSGDMLHVAAPIIHGGRLIGVLTVRRPFNFSSQFFFEARQKVWVYALEIALIVLILGLALSHWLARPVLLLTDYARAVRDGRKAPLPGLGGGELGELGKSFEEMKSALDGRKYVENYVRTLAHELKSPLSGIKGAVEILRDPGLPPSAREKFVSNIATETSRMQSSVETLLKLASIQSLDSLDASAQVDMVGIARELAEGAAASNPSRSIALAPDSAPCAKVKGDSYLLKEAVGNLLRNAIDFTRDGGRIEIALSIRGTSLELSIDDDGEGVPDFASARIFEKFYSLPRPDGRPKSSGLGLSIVQEIVGLHGGRVSVSNRQPKGVSAKISLPLAGSNPH